MDTFESSVLKKNKRLTIWLVASAFLNVACFSSALYQYMRPAMPLEPFSTKTTLDQDAEIVLKNYLTLSFQELVQKLLIKTEVEPGLKRRDLALSVLVNSYHVDIEKALNRQYISFLPLSFKEGANLKVVPICRGLIDADFEVIYRFIKQEAYPLTGKGLFFKIKIGIKDADLINTFYLSDSFSKIFDALKLQDVAITSEQLLQVLLKGDYQDMERYLNFIQKAPLHVEEFLTHFMSLGSEMAASLLLERPQFSVKTLTDKQAMSFIKLLSAYPDKQKKIADELFSSFRSDLFKQEIINMGLAKALPKEEVQKTEVNVIIKKFDHPLKKETVTVSKVEKIQRTYVIQEGDSLWKISRKFKVDVEKLKKANNLDSENLKPGKTLVIP